MNQKNFNPYIEAFDRMNTRVQKGTQVDPKYAELFSTFSRTLVPNTSNKTSFIDKGYRQNSTVYSLINKISAAATNVPLQVFEKRDTGALKEYKCMTNGLMNDSAIVKSTILKNKALKPAFSSDLQMLLDQPNPMQGYSEWVMDHMGFKLITGDSFIYGIRPETGANKGKIKEMHVLPSQYVEIHTGGIMKPIEGYSLSLYNGGVSKAKIPYDDLAHIKTFNPDYSSPGNHLYGQSPLQAAYRDLATNNDSTETGLAFLQNQGARGILAPDTSLPLTEEQAAAIRDKYKAKYSGAKNAGDIMITSMMFKWIDMGMPAADVALIEQFELSRAQLANVYNVPVVLLNDNNSNSFNNYREAKKQFYLEAVFPELISLRDELNRWLSPSYGKQYYIDFDFTAVPELQEDMEKVTRQLSLAWWISPNEKREAMKYEPRDEKEMDDIYILANFLPLSDGVTTREQGAVSQQLLEYSDYIKVKED